MNTQFMIDTTQGYIFYSVFNIFSLMLVTCWVFFSGVKKGYPLTSWFLIIMTGGMFYMLGQRVATYNLQDWNGLFTSFVLPTAGKKTILGGIAGLIGGVSLAKWWLRFRAPVLDHYALVLPFSMAISRVGCLLAGCCYGTQTTLPWGIHYDYKSRVFQSHLMQYKVQFSDDISAAIHPVQLYEVIGCLLITWLVWKTRKKWKARESLFVFFLLCYAVLRFFTEYVRAPEADIILAYSIYGLKAVQWILLGLAFSLLIILALKERIFSPGKDYPLFQSTTKLRHTVLMIFLCILGFLSRKCFTDREFILFLIFLVPVSAFSLVNIFKWLIRNGLIGKMRLNRQRKWSI